MSSKVWNGTRNSNANNNENKHETPGPYRWTHALSTKVKQAEKKNWNGSRDTTNDGKYCTVYSDV